MAKTDRHFINVFSAVIGSLMAFALVLIGISRLVDSGPKGARDTEDPLMRASAHERIKPFGQVSTPAIPRRNHLANKLLRSGECYDAGFLYE